MTRNHVPIEAAGVTGAEFGGSEENDVLRTYCAPEDGTPETPFYVPFGPNRKGQTHWRPKAYAGTTLQRMRSDKSFIYAREGEGDEARWWLAKDFAANLATGCPKGGTVLDPFLGSGTTLVAAARAGHSGVGIELNDAYASLAERRIQESSGVPARRLVKSVA